MPVTITRTHEGYLVNHPGQEVTIIPPRFEGKNQKKVLETFVRYLPENGSWNSDYLEFNHHIYQWQRISETGLLHQIGCYLSSFFLTSEKKVFALAEIGENELADIVCPNIIPVEVTERQTETRISLELHSERFYDPYTKLAALAFQQFEPQFNPENFSGCQTSLVAVDGELKLHFGQDHPANASTIRIYYDYLVRMYGKEKIDYIQHLYGIDFITMMEKGEALTPEHIYRMNIGVMNLEIQDVQQYYAHLIENDPSALNGNEYHCLLKTLARISASREGSDAEISEEKSAADEPLAGGRKLTGKVNKALSGEDFSGWMEEHFKGKPPFQALTSAQVELLAQSLAIQGEERERAFTGKAVQASGLVSSNPWLDQQRLVQSFSDYENTSNWDAFYETLSFAVANNSLVREHPTEKFRIGALIPTPRDENGMPHWYKVTSCVSNGFGIFSYTLEALGADSSLPPIKLYRGTTTNPYCLHGKVSVINDFNPFNTPGYLGKGLGDPYEAAFFKDRSIPVWVGYALDGEKQAGADSLKDAETSLQAANRALIEEKVSQHAPKTIPEILRKHDAVLVDLLLTTSGASNLLPVHFSGSYPDLISGLVNRYIQRKDPVEEKQIEKDAEQLKALLLQFIKNNPNECKQDAVMEVVDDLDGQILNRKQILAEQEQAKELVRQVYSPLLAYENRMKATDNPQEKLTIAKDWAEALIKEAKEQKEHPSQKRNEEIHFLGYSLGGSCAQVHAHHFFSAKERIPLPGRSLSIYAYDDPGINKEDNQAFIRFGNTHADLLERLGIKVLANHSQAAGDPVGLSGEAHLGGSVNPDELAKLARWMKFKGDVYERLEHPKAPSIAHSTMTHLIRFRVGTEGVDYRKTPYDAEMQGVIDEGTSPEAAELKSHVWKINFATSYFNEHFRRDIKNMIMLAVLADREKERNKGFTDPHGVFAVDQRGVVSKLLN